MIIGLSVLSAVITAAYLGGNFLQGRKSNQTGTQHTAADGGGSQDQPASGAAQKNGRSASHQTPAASSQPHPGSSASKPRTAESVSLQPDVMEALVVAVKNAGLDAAEIKIAPDNQAEQTAVVLELELPENSDPKSIKHAVQNYLGRSGLKMRWKDKGQAMLLELGSPKAPSHILAFKLPPGSVQETNTSEPPTAPSPKNGLPKLAIVMDDLGPSLEPVKQILALNMTLTYSILPNTAKADKVAALIKKAGRSYMVHLPMEPKQNTNGLAGEDALLLKMPTSQLVALTRKHLAKLPGAKGMNNHMGSAFTENAKAMLPVLEIIKEHGMFYLDSVTSAKTQGISVARKLGIPNGRRDVFLDYDKSGRVVAKQLKQALITAKQQGFAIAIAHPYPATIRALRRAKPMLSAMVELVDVESLMSTAP